MVDINLPNILEIIRQGESSSVEFKGQDVRPESLAREMVSLSNTLGGTILVGVEDDGTICGLRKGLDEEWIANIAATSVNPSIQPIINIISIEGKELAYIGLSKGKHRPYQTTDGKFWIRVGSTNRTASKEELSRLFQQAGLVHFDSSPIEGSSQKDLDVQRINDYWQHFYQLNFAKLDPTEQEKLLINASILTEFEDRNVCTVAGLLVFSNHPQRKLPQAEISFAAFAGESLSDALMDKKVVAGSILNQVEGAQALIKLLLPVPSTIEGMKRKEIHEFSDKSLRELLVNALVHRDYSIQTRRIQIHLFSNRLVISSPGRIANTLNIEKIKTGNSAHRNILLLKFMDNFHYIDGIGRGIPSVISELGPRAIFEEFGDEFRVTLLRSPITDRP